MKKWVIKLLSYWVIGCCAYGIAYGQAKETAQSPNHPITQSPAFADIAPLLTKHCASCHTASPDGRAAPFALVAYADAARRASQLVQVTQSGYMPPWKTTTPGFHNSRGLSTGDKATLKAWADSGAPEGDSRQPTGNKKNPNTQSPHHPIPQSPTSWPFGKPDLILMMPKAYPLAAVTGELSRCFVIPTGLTEEKWIRAVAFRPSNPRIVRYASLYLDPMRQGRKQEAISGAVGFYGFAGGMRPIPNGSLIDWSIGAAPLPFPPGVAAKLPKGGDFILQLRFQPTGKPETERMRIGLYFAERSRKPEAGSQPHPSSFLESVTLRLGVAELYLPWKSTATETDSFVLPVDAAIWEITPNVHPVGQKISVKAESLEGKTTEILEISDWDAAWKQAYRPETPLQLTKGTRLTLKIVYDNTEANPRNPWKPSHRIVPSIEFMEEMGGVWLRLLPSNPAEAATLRAALPAKARADFDIDEREPEGFQRPRPRPGPPVKPL